MLKKIMMATLAVGAMSLYAPSAQASHAFFDCNFNSVAQEQATGGQDTFTGGAYGVVASQVAGEAVSIRCYVTVDGVEASSTAPGSGTNLATAQGSVTYVAPEGSDVKLCGDWTAGAEAGSTCWETTRTQIPPQEVIDATGVADFIICPQLAGLDGTFPDVPGVIELTAEGDIRVADGGFWDCPPYEE